MLTTTDENRGGQHKLGQAKQVDEEVREAINLSLPEERQKSSDATAYISLKANRPQPSRASRAWRACSNNLSWRL